MNGDVLFISCSIVVALHPNEGAISGVCLHEQHMQHLDPKVKINDRNMIIKASVSIGAVNCKPLPFLSKDKLPVMSLPFTNVLKLHVEDFSPSLCHAFGLLCSVSLSVGHRCLTHPRAVGLSYVNSLLKSNLL